MLAPNHTKIPALLTMHGGSTPNHCTTQTTQKTPRSTKHGGPSNYFKCTHANTPKLKRKCTHANMPKPKRKRKRKHAKAKAKAHAPKLAKAKAKAKLHARHQANSHCVSPAHPKLFNVIERL